jgi:hypothetical protein
MGKVVCCEFFANGGQVNGFWLAEIDTSLDA